MAATPTFPATPVIGMGQITTANTNRDGTGTTVSILTGASAGTRINRLVIVGAGTTVASIATLYLYDGTNTRLFDEIVVAAVTPASTGTPAFRYEKVYNDLILPSTSWVLKAAITVGSQTLNVMAFGEDF